MKKEDVERFEKVTGQLDGVYEEITSLSKKSPNDGVNKFKLRLVNKVLEGMPTHFSTTNISHSMISPYLTKPRFRATVTLHSSLHSTSPPWKT